MAFDFYENLDIYDTWLNKSIIWNDWTCSYAAIDANLRSGINEYYLQ